MFESPGAVFIHSACLTLASPLTFAANLLLSPLPWFIISTQYWSSRSANILEYEWPILALWNVKIHCNHYFSDTKSTPPSVLRYSFMNVTSNAKLLISYSGQDKSYRSSKWNIFQYNYLLLVLFNFWLEENWKQLPDVRCNSS